jgi:hypothetical protein
MNRATFLLGTAVMVLFLGGGYFAIHQQQQITTLTSELSLAEGDLAKSADKYSGELSKLADKLTASESAHVSDVKRLDASLQGLKTPPSSEQVANSLLATQRGELLKAIETDLSANSDFLDAVRGSPGRDADPALVAKDLLPDTDFIGLVSDHIWATRRSDLISNPELIATIAAKVHAQYGAELDEAERGTGLAKTIAKELSTEPGFANLVASMSH